MSLWRAMVLSLLRLQVGSYERSNTTLCNPLYLEIRGQKSLIPSPQIGQTCLFLAGPPGGCSATSSPPRIVLRLKTLRRVTVSRSFTNGRSLEA